ncbi:MarR family winged helix-turn-helix transcriptional regulator [Streptomyces sp. NPDC006997]|uniref:MarR family winged helix-turn-helix transcriptional regulator n=1 Tax=Streptomyces sp. NPDC006997 TaxID=3155356 RepID=UPI003408723F
MTAVRQLVGSSSASTRRAAANAEFAAGTPRYGLQQAHHLLWNTMVSEETTSPRFTVLSVLVLRPGLDQRTVGERVGLDRSTVAEVVSGLTRRGLLDQGRAPHDGRRSLPRLTADGARTHRKLAVRAARTNRVPLAPLDAGEQALFVDLSRRLADAAEGLRNPAEPLVTPS